MQRDCFILNRWVTLAMAFLIVLGATGVAAAQALPQVKLTNDLDRPGEGYCIDILGVGPTARADLPLVAHNCLPDLPRVDRHAVFTDGRIRFPAFEACVTAFGVVTPLPGAPVILRPCGASESFLPAADLQRFTFNLAGQFQLVGSDLCLTVGAMSARTFSASDRWRTLTMQMCSDGPAELSKWN
ncbi:RICIN domain-containing protein [Roseobacter sp. YSTF-M11]|uniref:RICIN domain-containing protein n=1 Tax=Roseobacter insulae TaxID=2859783 RepID=A0A9X1FRN6_9RHOB|nr:RICIN domain-containing protein [Roseobacter insulae]MBW4706342.1 RICIN domain-containing protein [Roseobacter insulae]